MATINLRNLSDALYRKLKQRAEHQRRSIAQEVTQILADTLGEPESFSILELRGMGKEHRAGKDGTTHVAAERRAWD